MYLRHSKVKKNGKTGTYLRLVRSVRQGRKVRQETVAAGVWRARKPADRSQVERQTGRLLGRNTRTAEQFQIDVLEDDSLPSGMRLSWKEKSE